MIQHKLEKIVYLNRINLSTGNLSTANIQTDAKFQPNLPSSSLNPSGYVQIERDRVMNKMPKKEKDKQDITI